ncbi:MAG: hypothetical protein V1907_02220 [Candidatus Kerfeldbacteria bacterium]
MLITEVLFCMALIALAIHIWRRREAVLSIGNMLGVITAVALWLFLRIYGLPVFRNWVMTLSPPSTARHALIYMMTFVTYAAVLAIYQIVRQRDSTSS